MSEKATVLRSLEHCADADIDLTPLVYEHFFQRCPEAQSLMGDTDLPMRGRMVEQTILLFLGEADGFDNESTGVYLRWEVDNHLKAYGVSMDMYAEFLGAFQWAVKQGSGEHWDDATERAWSTYVGGVLDDIQRCAS